MQEPLGLREWTHVHIGYTAKCPAVCYPVMNNYAGQVCRCELVDCVLSDMAPNASGSRALDQERMHTLLKALLFLACSHQPTPPLLKPGRLPLQDSCIHLF